MKGCFIFLLAFGMITAQTLIIPESRTCRQLGSESAGQLQESHALEEYEEEEDSLPEYMSGQLMVVTMVMPRVNTGVLGFFICPEPEPGVEECLVKLPLKLADKLGDKLDISTMAKDEQYQIPVMLPEGVTCDKCTLLLETAVNGCNKEVSDGECTTLMTSHCADISIIEPKFEPRARKEIVRKIGGRPRLTARYLHGKLLF